MLAIEKGGVTDRADTDAATLVGDTVAQLGPLVPLGAEEAQLHELVSAEQLLKFGKEPWCKATAAELEGGFERLTKATQVGALRAREREFVHENGYLMA